MKISVQFYKDRQKFSAAHFTIFADGEVERLHGHNYVVEVTLEGDRLEDGMIFPFHLVKPVINRLCKEWDEYVLLPTTAPAVRIEENGDQVELHLETSQCRKFYSFPREDVVLLACNNISSENLAVLFLEKLSGELGELNLGLTGLHVSIAESSGQKVTVSSEKP
ncbi:MAG: 6-pyruvoyl tetrahydropterin synthase family protein [Acidobacteriota bacterium]|nr:6-pyruvoyl tetrahydropterin synthase family protein [Acidobacteriota bacterium]